MIETAIPQPEHRHETLARLAQTWPDLNITKVELGVKLFSAAVRMSRVYENQMLSVGLTPARFSVLITLLAAPGNQRQSSEIAQRLGVSRPTVTGVVDGLISEGLVVKDLEGVANRRHPVTLTEKGRQVIQRAAPEHFRRLEMAADNLTEDDVQTIEAALVIMKKFENTISSLIQGGKV